MEGLADGTSQKGQNDSDCYPPGASGGLGGVRSESKIFRFSGAGGVSPSDRPWTGYDQRTTSDFTGGIGSRLIAKLLEQRAEVLSRLDVVLQRKAEYEAKLEQIDRELTEARQMLAECLELENGGNE